MSDPCNSSDEPAHTDVLIHPSARIHSTAIVEHDVQLGAYTSIWDSVHIRWGSRLGDHCIVGGKSTIAYEVMIGHRVKINTNVYVCTGVTIEDGVMVGAGTVFTNDVYPRATNKELTQLRSSEPDEHTLKTHVSAGASIGAQCTIGCDLTIGRYAMIGMASVVTRSVPDFALVYGNPAQLTGWVCRCGQPLVRFKAGERMTAQPLSCPCGDHYLLDDGVCRLDSDQ